MLDIGEIVKKIFAAEPTGVHPAGDSHKINGCLSPWCQADMIVSYNALYILYFIDHDRFSLIFWI